MSGGTPQADGGTPQAAKGDHEVLAAWFRRHWAEEIPFDRHAGMVLREWGAERVVVELPYRAELSAHEGIFHGGLIAALIDTTGSAAVVAGHDFSKGTRVTTVSMTVNYLASAPFESAVATGRAVHRGGRLHHAEVEVRSSSGRLLARGSLVVNISGRRPGLPTGAGQGAGGGQ